MTLDDMGFSTPLSPSPAGARTQISDSAITALNFIPVVGGTSSHLTINVTGGTSFHFAITVTGGTSFHFTINVIGGAYFHLTNK